jgi:two-component system, response regulator YesN
LTDLRLGTAREKLLDSDMKVYEVAQEVGYRDVKYFTRIFKKHFGLTPNECRTFSAGRNMSR